MSTLDPPPTPRSVRVFVFLPKLPGPDRKQQAGQIMNFWQENNHSESQEDTEDDEEGSSEGMDMDT